MHAGPCHIAVDQGLGVLGVFHTHDRRGNLLEGESLQRFAAMDNKAQTALCWRPKAKLNKVENMKAAVIPRLTPTALIPL